jgi:hypothetical protein
VSDVSWLDSEGGETRGIHVWMGICYDDMTFLSNLIAENIRCPVSN